MKAIDVHAHISTRPGVLSMITYQKGIMEYYLKTQVTDEQVLAMAKTEAAMAQDFVNAGVKGILVAWDAETNTGLPRVSNDYIAQVVRDYPQALSLIHI